MILTYVVEQTSDGKLHIKYTVDGDNYHNLGVIPETNLWDAKDRIEKQLSTKVMDEKKIFNLAWEKGNLDKLPDIVGKAFDVLWYAKRGPFFKTGLSPCHCY